MAVNVAGVKAESGAQTYRAVHIDGAAALARAAKAADRRTFAHVSGIGADAGSVSPYIASKGLGEQVTLQEFPDATILRPSVVFGPEDDFFNRFGELSRFFWVIPLLGGGGTRRRRSMWAMWPARRRRRWRAKRSRARSTNSAAHRS